MTEREWFHQTFDKFHASESVEKEIITMRQHNKKFRPLRPMAVAAACLCLLVGSAFAANAATGGELFQSVRTVFGTAEIRQEQKIIAMDDYTVGTFTVTGMNAEEILPEGAVHSVNLSETAGVYLTEDGRVMLREAGAEDLDMTEAWAEGGTFTAGGVTFTVETAVDGSGNVAWNFMLSDVTLADDPLMAGGWLFDPNQFDLNALMGEGMTVEYDGDTVIMEGSEESDVFIFSATGVPEE